MIWWFAMLRKRYLHKLMTRRLCFVFIPTVTVEVIFLVDFDFPAWNQLNGMISPQNIALLYLFLFLVSLYFYSMKCDKWICLDHFLLITCDFLPQKNLELICSTRLNSISGSAIGLAWSRAPPSCLIPSADEPPLAWFPSSDDPPLTSRLSPSRPLPFPPPDVLTPAPPFGMTWRRPPQQRPHRKAAVLASGYSSVGPSPTSTPSYRASEFWPSRYRRMPRISVRDADDTSSGKGLFSSNLSLPFTHRVPIWFLSVSQWICIGNAIRWQATSR
jgi:hypothetical protein